MGYQAADDGHAMHGGRPMLAPLLRIVDAAIASLQRVRNRIEQPAEEEESTGNARRRAAREPQAPPAAAVPAAAPSRWRRAAVIVLMLICSGILGLVLSYRLLSDSLNAREVVVDAMRDEIAQLEKERTRIERDKAKYQKQVYENDKEIRAFQHEIEDYRSELDALRGELNAMKGARGPLAQPSRSGTAAGGKSPPQKTATCTTGTANTAANLARCVEEFNRK